MLGGLSGWPLPAACNHKPHMLCLLVQAADLDHLLAQMSNHPAGKEVRWGLLLVGQGRHAGGAIGVGPGCCCALLVPAVRCWCLLCVAGACSAASAAWLPASHTAFLRPRSPQAMFVFLSRTATGSSARFSSAVAAVYLLMQAELRAAVAAGGVSPTARVCGEGGWRRGEGARLLGPCSSLLTSVPACWSARAVTLPCHTSVRAWHFLPHPPSRRHSPSPCWPPAQSQAVAASASERSGTRLTTCRPSASACRPPPAA